jgi:protein disulfide-isomerase A1
LDANAYQDIGEKEQIEGFPTIKFYVNGLVFKYNGERNSQEILAYLNKKTSLPSTNLATEEDIKAQKDATGLRCIYALSKNSSIGVYFGVAAIAEDYTFYHAPYELVVKVFPEAKENSVILLKDFDERMNVYTDEMLVEKFEKFLKKSSTPILLQLNQKVLEEVLNPKGTPGLFLFYNSTDEASIALEEVLRKVAMDLKGKGYLFVLADPSEGLGERVAEFFGIESASLPLLEFLISKEELMRYRHEGAITEESIKAFVEDWENGKVSRYLKSEPEPTENLGPMFNLVGTTFKGFVLDNTDDVIVTFYAPWCGHCKKLEPMFEKLAETLKDYKQLKFARMDSTKNDVEGHSIESFPTIKFFPGNNKSNVIPYDGNRTAIDIATFIKEKASHPIEIPEVVNEIKSEEETPDVDTEELDNQEVEPIPDEDIETEKDIKNLEEEDSDSDSDDEDEDEEEEKKRKKEKKEQKKAKKEQKKKEKKEKKKEEKGKKERKKEEKEKKKKEKEQHSEEQPEDKPQEEEAEKKTDL